MRTIRVFPRRTSMTPNDDYAFVGDPPLLKPEASEVHISVSFTWDIDKGIRLMNSWRQYYPIVKLSGPTFKADCNGFNPGFYVKHGVTFTSRGCNNNCPWCLQPEGKLRPIDIHPGNIIQDNNLLQCDYAHISKVVDMLRKQRHIAFSGGLDSRLLTDQIADDLKGLSIYQLFLACDTKEAIRPLWKAASKLSGFRRNQLRCYVLLAFGGETISEAVERLEEVWGAGYLPFAQLYQPPDRYIHYPKGWRDLARTWSRPAATKSLMSDVAKECY